MPTSRIRTLLEAFTAAIEAITPTTDPTKLFYVAANNPDALHRRFTFEAGEVVNTNQMTGNGTGQPLVLTLPIRITYRERDAEPDATIIMLEDASAILSAVLNSAVWAAAGVHQLNHIGTRYGRVYTLDNNAAIRELVLTFQIVWQEA